MTRKIIAAVATAATVATTFTATTAQADGNSVLDFLAGATALVVLADTLGHRHHYHGPHYVYRNVEVYHGDHYGHYDGGYAYQREVYHQRQIPGGEFAYQREQRDHGEWYEGEGR